MKIRELLSYGVLKTSKILTKEIGLDNEVESAMVLEAIDIEKWSKRNQLILTSFYAFNNVAMEELEEFFQKMHQIGISGLVVKVDRLIADVPEWLIELCFDYEIPLIKVPQTISYETILLTIYEPLLNHQTHVLRTYYDVRQRFTKLERNLYSFEQIIEEFYHLIEKPCLFKIPEKNIEIRFGNPRMDLVVLDKKETVNSEFTKNHYKLLTLFSQNEGKTTTALEVNIFSSYTKECSLIVYQEEETIKETDLMIIENTIDVLQEKFSTEYLLEKERYAHLNNLADAILQNTPANPDELNSLLNEANMADYAYYQAIVFSTKTQNAQLAKSEILTSLRPLREKSIYFNHHNYSVVLYNFNSAEAQIEKEEVKQLFKNLFETYPNLMFAISTLKQKDGLKEILIECLDLIRFNEEFYSDCVLDNSNIGIFRYFVQEDKLNELEQIVPEKLLLLSQKNYDLFETFYYFLSNSRNYKKTAEAMFLHSKTIRYRLDKVAAILDIDLTNPIQMLNYEVAVYIIKMRKRSGLSSK